MAVNKKKHIKLKRQYNHAKKDLDLGVDGVQVGGYTDN